MLKWKLRLNIYHEEKFLIKRNYNYEEKPNRLTLSTKGAFTWYWSICDILDWISYPYDSKMEQNILYMKLVKINETQEDVKINLFRKDLFMVLSK